MSSILKHRGHSNARPSSDWSKLCVIQASGVIPPTPGPSQNNFSAWYRAGSVVDDGVLDNGAVASWRDESGWGSDLAQAVAGKRPILKTNILNGHPVIRFTGASAHDLFRNDPGDLGGAPGLTIFAVAKPATWTGLKTIISLKPDAIDLGLALTQSQYRFICPSAASGVQGATGEGAGPWAWRILRGFFNDVSNQFGLKISGTSFTTTNFNTDAYACTQFCVGARDDTEVVTSFDGDIAEIIIYRDRISGTDLTQTENYLSQKYGITL